MGRKKKKMKKKEEKFFCKEKKIRYGISYLRLKKKKKEKKIFVASPAFGRASLSRPVGIGRQKVLLEKTLFLLFVLNSFFSYLYNQETIMNARGWMKNRKKRIQGYEIIFFSLICTFFISPFRTGSRILDHFRFPYRNQPTFDFVFTDKQPNFIASRYSS